MHTTLARSLALACVLLSHLPATAALVDTETALPVTPAAIAVMTSPEGISYASGGVGDSSQQAMEVIRKDFNLHITFARPKSGDFITDVQVGIENAHHEQIVNTVSSGPFFFADLPTGRYRITADAGGKSQTRSVSVTKGHTRGLVLYFARPQ